MELTFDFFDFDPFEDNCLPGDPSYDDLYGGNLSGLYPDEEHFVIEVSADGTTLSRGTFSNAGCGDWNITVTAVWNVESMRKKTSELRKGEAFKLKAEGDDKTHTFKVSKKFKQARDNLIVDLID